jgi:hypothetical protein
MNKNQPPVINQTHPLANQFTIWADSNEGSNEDPNDLTSPEPPKTPATPSEQVFDLTVEPANSPGSTAVSPQDDMTFDQHRITETETKRPSIPLTQDGSNAPEPNQQENTQPVEEQAGYLTLTQMAEEQHAKVEQTQQQQKRTAGAEVKKTKKRRLSSMFREARPEHGQNTEPKKTRCVIS